MSTKKLLQERGNTHGVFSENARIQVGILRTMGILPAESHLSDSQIAVWLNIAGKQARAVSGNPNYIDNYKDVGGYSQLEVDILMNSPEGLDVKNEYYYPYKKN